MLMIFNSLALQCDYLGRRLVCSLLKFYIKCEVKNVCAGGHQYKPCNIF